MPCEVKICRVCGEEFTFHPGKPGYINECEACTRVRGSEVPKSKATPDGDEWVPMPEDKIPSRRHTSPFLAPHTRGSGWID